MSDDSQPGATETQPTGDDAAKKPWWKRWWGVALIAFLALMVIVAVTDGPDDTEPTDDVAAPGEEAAEAPDEPDPDPEPELEADPEAEPEPEPESAGFGNGTYVVGDDIEPGTYRSTGSGMCYWARLSGFSGELDDIIANGNSSPEIVTVGAQDAGFETQGCGEWVAVAETAPAAPATDFGDGTYQIGVHIEPGTYRADGDGMCYWARMRDFSHELDGIITNGNSPGVIEVQPGDAGFTTSGCGTWTRTG